jgi:hypothetical protein
MNVPSIPETDRLNAAIARHVWMIADYIREVTNDPMLQGKIASNVGGAVLIALKHRQGPAEDLLTRSPTPDCAPLPGGGIPQVRPRHETGRG